MPSGVPFGVSAVSAGMREEAEAPEPVVHADEDDAAAGEGGAVVDRRRAAAVHEAAAVDPHHHRQRRRAARRRRPHVEVEAVFRGRRAERRRVAAERLLHAVGRVVVGGERGRPRLDRLRRLPAQVADRRRRERDALVGGDVAGDDACHRPGVRLHGSRRLGRRRGGPPASSAMAMPTRITRPR